MNKRDRTLTCPFLLVLDSFLNRTHDKLLLIDLELKLWLYRIHAEKQIYRQNTICRVGSLVQRVNPWYDIYYSAPERSAHC